MPKEVRFETRRTTLEMLKEHSDLLPHAWIAGDDEMVQNARFRRDLHESREQYLLAVPSDTLIRDLDAHRRHTKVAARFRSGLSSALTAGAMP